MQLNKAHLQAEVQRRISVRLPLRVRGKDARGFAFEEDTNSENLCRSGAAFRTRFDVAIGSSLEIRIPHQGYTPRRPDHGTSETQGQVVHVSGNRRRTAKKWSECDLSGRASSACSARNLADIFRRRR